MPDLSVTEQYRIIGTKIDQDTARCSVVLLTSACPGDGKSTTATNLALAMALGRDASVLLLNADFQRNRKEAPIPSRKGLMDVLAKTCSIEDALLRVEEAPNLQIMSSGTTAANASQLLSTAEWRVFILELREQFQRIVIDAPPFGAVSDYYHLQSVADGIAFVVRPEHTRRSAFSEAMKHIPRQKLLGLIVNNAKDWFFWRQYESYGITEAKETGILPKAAAIHPARTKHHAV